MSHKKKEEKSLIFKSLHIEMQQMWNMKCMIMLVVVGATGIVTNIMKKNFEAMPEKHSIDSM
jgi:hypothetical protein